ncbi:sulfatase-like hydrolase/transferase, partial [Candidatus Calescamantes bacterium]|nr:sulfatase-like hydrolase/transferase [Candidatus Calescamantes bacterium]
MADKKKPNILFIMDDEHNARCLSCEGHPDVKTPNLDKLAEGGVRFTRAFAQGAICVPSRVSFFTGQYLSTHGIFGNGGWLPPEVLSLAYYLKEKAGYQTGAVGKLHLPRWKTDGLDYKKLCDDADVDMNEKTDYQCYLEEHGFGKYYRKYENYEFFMAYISQIPEEHSLERWTADQAIEFIEKRNPEKPFFLWMSFERPHAP